MNRECYRAGERYLRLEVTVCDLEAMKVLKYQHDLGGVKLSSRLFVAQQSAGAVEQVGAATCG